MAQQRLDVADIGPVSEHQVCAGMPEGGRRDPFFYSHLGAVSRDEFTDHISEKFAATKR